MEAEVQNTVQFSKNLLDEIAGFLSRYPSDRKKSALLPALHAVQAELGWLSASAMDKTADLLGIKPIEVYEVASFYSMYHLQPVGKHVLEVCRTGPCCLVGSDAIISHLETKLGVKVGGTSADGLFTLKTVECLAACGMGPVLQIGPEYTFYENLTTESVDNLLEELRRK